MAAQIVDLTAYRFFAQKKQWNLNPVKEVWADKNGVQIHIKWSNDYTWAYVFNLTNSRVTIHELSPEWLTTNGYTKITKKTKQLP